MVCSVILSYCWRSSSLPSIVCIRYWGITPSSHPHHPIVGPNSFHRWRPSRRLLRDRCSLHMHTNLFGEVHRHAALTFTSYFAWESYLDDLFNKGKIHATRCMDSYSRSQISPPHLISTPTRRWGLKMCVCIVHQACRSHTRARLSSPPFNRCSRTRNTCAGPSLNQQKNAYWILGYSGSNIWLIIHMITWEEGPISPLFFPSKDRINPD